MEPLTMLDNRLSKIIRNLMIRVQLNQYMVDQERVYQPTPMSWLTTKIKLTRILVKKIIMISTKKGNN
jgi:hypothetical protein